MKQIETKIQKIVKNFLSIYKEIGIDFYIPIKSTINKLETLSHNNFNENHILFGNKKVSSKIVNKEKQIEELGYLFKNIEGCNLKKTSTNFVNFYGNINSKLLIIDSPPDIDEDKTGISFVSKKGELFEKMLNAIELKKDEVFIVKSIPWRPPGNRYPTNDEVKICRPFILNLIQLIRPKIIVCLGEVPTNQLLELDQSILRVRGKWRLFKSETIKILDELKYDIFVLPTFSITHLLERPDLKKYAWEDMKLLRDKIKETS